FRYHPLFADFLQAQLRAREPEAEVELQRRASEWFERASLWADAVRSAMAAGDERHALDIMDRCAMTLIEHGEYVTLLDWLARFPRDAVLERPRLLAAKAWALGLTMRHQETDEVIAALADRGEPARDPALAAEMELLRSGNALMQDDFRDDAFPANPS